MSAGRGVDHHPADRYIPRKPTISEGRPRSPARAQRMPGPGDRKRLLPHTLRPPKMRDGRGDQLASYNAVRKASSWVAVGSRSTVFVGANASQPCGPEDAHPTRAHRPTFVATP